jgi:hypothetical protein
VNKLNKEKKQLGNITHVVLIYRSSSATYVVFLHGYLFQLISLAKGNPRDLRTPKSFLEAFVESKKEDTNFLCELYQQYCSMTKNRTTTLFW